MIPKFFQRKLREPKSVQQVQIIRKCIRPKNVWNKDAAALLKQFLDTAIGQIFLAELIANRPNFLSGAEAESVSLQAKLIEGYEKAVLRILSLSEPPDEAGGAVEHYPNLDDDSKWEDKPRS